MDSGKILGFSNNPVKLYLMNNSGLKEYFASYNEVKHTQNSLIVEAVVKCDNGCAFIVTDIFRENPNGLEMVRNVEVAEGAEYGGFFSGFEMELSWEYSNLSFFAPGTWYHTNEHTPDNSIGNPRRSHVVNGSLVETGILTNMIREDRLTLPLFMAYNAEIKGVFCLIHNNVTGETVKRDDDADILVDKRLGFGSIGERHYNDRVWMCFWYPGTEGDISYPPMWVFPVICNKQSELAFNPFKDRLEINPNKERWSYRFHPLEVGFQQRYEVLIFYLSGYSYPESMERVWRNGVSIYKPKIYYNINLEKVEDASISILAKMAKKLNPLKGCCTNPVGIPTWVDCFSGKTAKLQNTFAIGFVGRNIEAGYLFLFFSVRRGLKEYVELGRRIIDFWTYCSGMGLSHTEFDATLMDWVDGGKNSEGSLQVFLRQVSEAHLACLKAWKLELDLGFDHKQWFGWVRSFANWAIDNQNQDGSFFRTYAIDDGRPVSAITSDCAHIIPFLLKFGQIVGDNKYIDAAIKVGEYLWERFHREGHFMGGTLDNPNCYDKEACVIALEAYLELYKVTRDKKWLDAAKVSANFAETWIYMWNVPMPLDDPERFYPPDWTTVGLQVITTGCSAVDMYLSRSAYLFRELFLLTGDDHYRLIAEILHFNTKGVVQIGKTPSDEGYFGYAMPGFQIEHWGMGRGRGFGLNSGWLPWVSVNHLVDIVKWREQDNKYFA